MAERAGGVVTFVLTDIERSSHQWESHPDLMPRVLATHDRILEEGIARHGGTVLTTHGEGDSFFAVFPLATQAVAAACAIQRDLADQEWPTGIELLVRMAVHSGEAGGDYRGRVANRCARVRALARGGQVLITAATSELVQDSLPPGVRLVDLGERGLRGMARPERIFQLLVRPPDPGVPAAGGSRPVELEIAADLARDLAAARDLLAGLRRLHAANRESAARARSRINQPTGLAQPLPDEYLAEPETGLGPRLERIERLVALGAADVRADLRRWREAAESWLGRERLVEATNRAPIDRRGELRGLLGALKAKAAAVGAVEDPELSELARLATASLYTAPTDLASAAALVERYRAGLLARCREGEGPP